MSGPTWKQNVAINSLHFNQPENVAIDMWLQGLDATIGIDGGMTTTEREIALSQMYNPAD